MNEKSFPFPQEKLFFRQEKCQEKFLCGKNQQKSCPKNCKLRRFEG